MLEGFPSDPVLEDGLEACLKGGWILNMKQVWFSIERTKEMAIFIATLEKEGIAYEVQQTSEGWKVLIRGY